MLQMAQLVIFTAYSIKVINCAVCDHNIPKGMSCQSDLASNLDLLLVAKVVRHNSLSHRLCHFRIFLKRRFFHTCLNFNLTKFRWKK